LALVFATLTFFALAAFGAILLLDEDDTATGDATTASPSRTATVTPAPTAKPTRKPTATPEPTVTPNPSDIPAGGEVPGGQVPDVHGNIPENVNVGPEMSALQQELASLINQYKQQSGTDAAVAVTDLQTGETISVNGNAAHKTGCVINLYGLLAAVSEFETGAASPWSNASNIKEGIGGSHPPFVRAFLQNYFGSDTAGIARARELMAELGLVITTYDHVPYYGGEDPPPNLATALESNKTLAAIWNRQLFNDEWSQYTIDVLNDGYYYVAYILPKYLPWSATVGHKIGYHWDFDGWVNNDIGIVQFTGSDGQQKAYVISYYSQYAPSEYAGYSFGARLSLKVWNTMGPKYGASAMPDVPYIPPVTPPPTPEPTPTEVPTPEPTQPPTPAPTPTPKPTKSPTPSPTRSPTPSPTPSATASATP
jgi:hypothetical protein